MFFPSPGGIHTNVDWHCALEMIRFIFGHHQVLFLCKFQSVQHFMSIL